MDRPSTAYSILRIKPRYLQLVISSIRVHTAKQDVEELIYDGRYPQYLFLRTRLNLSGFIRSIGTKYVYTFGRHTQTDSKAILDLLTVSEKPAVTSSIALDDRVVIISKADKVYGRVVNLDADYVSVAIDSNARFPIVCKVSIKTSIIKKVDD